MCELSASSVESSEQPYLHLSHALAVWIAATCELISLCLLGASRGREGRGELTESEPWTLMSPVVAVVVRVVAVVSVLVELLFDLF